MSNIIEHQKQLLESRDNTNIKNIQLERVKLYERNKILKEENKKLQEHIKELVSDDVNELKIEKLNKTIENWKAKWVKHMME